MLTILSMLMLVSSLTLVSTVYACHDHQNDNNNDNDNNKKGTITVEYSAVSSYYGKGKIVIRNEDTGKNLVVHDLNFAKQHNSQGDNCCVKVYTFDASNTHYGDDISAKVTGGGGSWENSPVNYKNNLRISMFLEEIGEDVDGNFAEYDKASLKKCATSDGSPPCIENDGTISYSCDDVRHFNSEDERCLYWDKGDKNWGTQFWLGDFEDNNNVGDNEKVYNYNTKNLTLNKNNEDYDDNGTRVDDAFMPVEDEEEIIGPPENNAEANAEEEPEIVEQEPEEEEPEEQYEEPELIEEEFDAQGNATD